MEAVENGTTVSGIDAPQKIALVNVTRGPRCSSGHDVYHLSPSKASHSQVGRNQPNIFVF